MNTSTAAKPVVKTLDLRCSAEHAFTVYTTRMADWWPVTHSISQGDLASLVMECRLGGRIYETNGNGEELPWGEITVWEPSGRLIHSWHPGFDPADANEVEVTFSSTAEGCRVVLEHRSWPNTEAGLQQRQNYETGWDLVLAPYVSAVDQPA